MFLRDSCTIITITSGVTTINTRHLCTPVTYDIQLTWALGPGISCTLPAADSNQTDPTHTLRCWSMSLVSARARERQTLTDGHADSNCAYEWLPPIIVGTDRLIRQPRRWGTHAHASPPLAASRPNSRPRSASTAHGHWDWRRTRCAGAGVTLGTLNGFPDSLNRDHCGGVGSGRNRPCIIDAVDVVVIFGVL